MTVPNHDAVVAFVAANRYPFPGQTTWPKDNVTLTNVPVRRRSVPAGEGEYFPDIVVVGGSGRTREIGEVETTLDPAKVPLWRAASLASLELPEFGTRAFYLYVPAGSEAATQRLLEDNGIAYSGVRGYRADASGRLSIVPFVTRGDPYDHRGSL